MTYIGRIWLPFGRIWFILAYCHSYWQKMQPIKSVLPFCSALPIQYTRSYDSWQWQHDSARVSCWAPPCSNRSICPGSHRPCCAYYASSVNKLIEVPSEGQTRVGPDGDATWRIWWIDMCSADDAAVATITVAICQRFSDWYYSAFIAVYWQYLSCCVTETHFTVQHDWWVLLRHPVAVATESACLPGTWQRQMALYVVSHGIVHCYKAV